MYGVVNEGGTGVRARLPNMEVCGKTGTAQLASNDFLKGSGSGERLKDNAWFVASRRARLRRSWWWRCSSTASTGTTRRRSCAT